MVFWRNVQSTLPKGSSCMETPNPSPTVKESIQEAAKNRLAKESKLKITHDAVMIDDLDELAGEDRETVKRYRDKIMANKLTSRQSNDSSPQGEGDDMGNRNITVCDDVHVHVNEAPSKEDKDSQLPRETKTPLLSVLAVAVALVGAGSLGGIVTHLVTKKPDVPPVKTPVSNDDADTRYTLEHVKEND